MNTPKHSVQHYSLYRRIKTQKQNDELVTKAQKSDHYTSLLKIISNTIQTHGTYLSSLQGGIHHQEIILGPNTIHGSTLVYNVQY